MIGQHTKCDLSFGLAKLDIEMVKKHIEIHFHAQLDKMGKLVSNVRDNSLTEEDRQSQVSSMSAHGTDSMLMLAQTIAETTEILSTLYGTDCREIETVNQKLKKDPESHS